MSQSLKVLVTGATGHQGGATARLLLSRGHSVRALTRKVDSPAAQALAKLGAELVAGDLADRASLEKAAQGVDAVFSVSTFFEAGVDVETQQGRNVADATKAAGVKFLLYSSVDGANLKTGVPHFDSKWRVEEYLQGLGLPHAVIAPSFFMDNIASPMWLPQLRQGSFAMALPPARKLKMIAVENIGGFAVQVLENREQFVGQRVDIGSDEVSGPEVAEVLSRYVGQPIRYVETPLEQLRAMSHEMAVMFEWFDKVGYQADVAGLRQKWPQVGWLSLEDWAKKQDWAALLRPSAA